MILSKPIILDMIVIKVIEFKTFYSYRFIN